MRYIVLEPLQNISSHALLMVDDSDESAGRLGTTLSLQALAGGGRSARNAALCQLELALRTDGWARIADARLEAPTSNLYLAAERLFADVEACEAHTREVLYADGGGRQLGLAYLGESEEPLYDARASKQHVHSWNMHEELTAAECDERLRACEGYEGEERALAHAYHTWSGAAAAEPLRAASAALRRELVEVVCEPLLRALASLLGLDEKWLSSRCEMRHSDNTSLLRCLEYPPPPTAADVRHSAGDDDAVWGVSTHTDFEGSLHAWAWAHSSRRHGTS